MSLPADFGQEVFRDGDWVLFRDYTTPGWTPIVTIAHCCYGENWRIKMGSQSRKSRECSDCHTPIPDKFFGLYELANWDR